MHHEFSLAYLSVFGLAPPEMITVAWHAGYDYVGLRLQPVVDAEPVFALASDRSLLRKTKKRLEDSGVRVLDVELIRLTPDFDVAAFDALLDISADLGARHIIAQAADVEISRAADHLGQLCDAARPRGLSIGLEFVTWTETPDLDRASRIVGAAQRPNAGLLIDTLHFSRSRCSVAQLAELPREWFRYAQVCDAPRQSPESVDGLIHAARNDRLFLGEGGLDLSGILGALPPELPYSVEIPRTALARVIGAQECARLALVTARKFIRELHHPASIPGLQAPAAGSPSSRSSHH
ncbi:sugar phosphate isomerase/epimerase [Povalibacter uvarum]|uniref:Sugar phosphate isomerase/epimerase n=1 Tax=Povalibacter uvarum TaxID=732238 RepID=A0A841HN58_9GAMM|nr:TIM barrel protein [Povalibacter uvarum]MBB6093512.1 sugar phosphate isomerase/epimerase [Povalibacter uvarum]